MSSEPSPEPTTAATQESESTQPGRGYSYYVLVVLVLVYVFNFIDRQIISILAEDLRADLGLTDANIGFLYGTAFAVFYAVFGIPLGRLADIWVRRTQISIGLCFWSLMTALSGTAKSFAGLATYRVGVGVGESSASPAAFSMLGDYFPPRVRATVMAIYSSGVYIGAGIGILIGGLVVDNWNDRFPGGGPFGLVGWQAAFMVVGVPGVLLAIWVRTLREPIRGQSEGLPERAPHPHPFRELGKEVMAVLPPLTIVNLARTGTTKTVASNLAAAGGCALGAWLLTLWLGADTAAQWIALAIGLYAFFSWVQGLALRDHPSFAMIYKSRAIVYGMIGFAFLAFVGYGWGLFIPPFFQRTFELSAGQVSIPLGLSAAIGGWLGVTGGGIASDAFRRRSPRARPYLGILTAFMATPVAVLIVTTPNLNGAYAFNLVFQALSSFWIGSGVALANELVLPRMRGTSSAFYLLTVTFIGLALGPFSMGQISARLIQSGATPTESLRNAMLLGLIAYVFAVFFLWLSSRSVESEEAQRLDRARAAGESV